MSGKGTLHAGGAGKRLLSVHHGHSASGSGTLHAGGAGKHLISSHHRRKTASHHSRKARRPQRRALPGLLGHEWVTGYNDHAPTCVPAAVANSLALATGQHVSDDDVLLLYYQAGGAMTGVPAPAVLAALAAYGIGGHYPDRYGRASVPLPGDIVGISSVHAACYAGDSLITWGAMLPLDGWELDGEVWRIDWTGPR